MAVPIKPRRTFTAGKVPTTANLQDGEIGVNVPDGKIYVRQGSTVQLVASKGADWSLVENKPNVAIQFFDAYFRDLKADRGDGTGALFLGNDYIYRRLDNRLVFGQDGLEHVIYHTGNFNPSESSGIRATQRWYSGGGGISAFAANGPWGQQQGSFSIQWDGNRIWQIGAETTGDFNIWSYTGTGAYVGNPLSIRADGQMTVRGPGSATGDLVIQSSAPTIRCFDSTLSTIHWIHCYDGQHGFLANNAYSWTAYRSAANDWVCTGNVIAYASDERLKTNIVDVAHEKVEEFFDNFKVREFDWDKAALDDMRPTFNPTADHEIGGIAQEVEEFYPNMVTEHSDGIKTIMWEKAVPLLIAELQSLRKRVAELEAGNGATK